MKIDVTIGDKITSAAIRYDYPLLFEEKNVPVMAYTLETVLAEKYETIIRRNIGNTRARDFYDLYILYHRDKKEIRMDVLRSAVMHTAEKRMSVDDMKEWQEILEDIRQEKQLYHLWDNYMANNPFIGVIEFHKVLDKVEEFAEQLDL